MGNKLSRHILPCPPPPKVSKCLLAKEHPQQKLVVKNQTTTVRIAQCLITIIISA